MLAQRFRVNAWNGGDYQAAAWFLRIRLPTFKAIEIED
jgi:hypothetical protein